LPQQSEKTQGYFMHEGNKPTSLRVTTIAGQYYQLYYSVG